ncbi:MAG: indole-3-glycerol-phosphate synthase [Candidatus Bathyarchaeota archaeon]|nr:indole-3-glycerol-phosphate synthase [Gammaproteobacteria bacterium]MCL5877388.1 indole-3-glycerol-phosphate synthase [Candidatus Bathyarchaeota archaeon]
MNDFLDTLAMDAVKTIESGYYQNITARSHHKISLKAAIQNCKTNAVITEIKSASPSLGTIRSNTNPAEIAKAMQRGGAVGLSVLTEPVHFKGSLEALSQARAAVKLPVLMKDVVIVADQIEVAAKIGANAVLLIQALFDRRCTEMGVDKMIAYAHAQGLEVLLEAHNEAEFKAAIETDADLIGINNRNLDTLKIDLKTTQQIIESQGKHGRTVVSESGIKTSGHLQFLRGCGADAFLVGSSIMLTDDIESKVKELVNTP